MDSSPPASPRRPPTLAEIDAAAGIARRNGDMTALARLAEAALRLYPDCPDGWEFKASVQASRGEHDEALASAQRALELAPQRARSHFRVGIHLQAVGQYDEAMRSFDEAMRHDPGHGPTQQARAILLGDLGRVGEAIMALDALLRVQPALGLAKHLKGELLLLQGDYANGWPLVHPYSHFTGPRAEFSLAPLWQGESLAGKRLLVHSTIGYGDYLMYARFVPALVARGATVFLQAPRALETLLRTSFPEATVFAIGAQAPKVDLQCPVMGLAGLLQVRVDTVPAEFPFLRVPEASSRSWQARLGTTDRLRVGLVWSSRSNRMIDRTPLKRRSMPLAEILPLLQVPVEWHSLQKEVEPGDVELMKTVPQLADHSKELVDFADTAALVEAMDVVISIDTSIAHLAGALGRPLWMMLPFSSDFRWPRGGPSPWYPDAWLVRQTEGGDWRSVVATIAERLSTLRK